jgi:hypothetical protein
MVPNIVGVQGSDETDELRIGNLRLPRQEVVD